MQSFGVFWGVAGGFRVKLLKSGCECQGPLGRALCFEISIFGSPFFFCAVKQAFKMYLYALGAHCALKQALLGLRVRLVL